ncbi:MAG: hypothetical protein Q8Q86_01925, partial [Candidatus Daviesbacteria bacterium]|nr:hypothetical protein [Candidatus Daviesbacteria bacterium]
GTLLGTQSLNVAGTIVDGPRTADGFIWWNINYDTGVDGWSVGDFLTKGVADIPALATNPIDTLRPGYWYRVPDSKLRSVMPNPLPPGTSGAGGILAESSGAFDTKRNQLIIWGGGHEDYSGNELYSFDIDTLKWTRIWGPTPTNLINSLTVDSSLRETYQDGNPASRHTRDGLEYLPNIDRFWSNGGSLWSGSGGNSTMSWMFDIANFKWERKMSGPGSFSNVYSAYDPKTGNILVHRGFSPALYEYNPTANTWTQRSQISLEGTIGYRRTAVFDPKRRHFYLIGIGEVLRYDLSKTGLATVEKISLLGDIPFIGMPGPGVEYDPISDQIVVWPHGPDIFTMNLDTNVWTKHSKKADDATILPAVPGGGFKGAQGRFRYIPSKNAF